MARNPQASHESPARDPSGNVPQPEQKGQIMSLREAQAAENHALAVLHFERRRVAELSADLAAAEAQLGIAEDAYRDAANRVLKMARP